MKQVILEQLTSLAETNLALLNMTKNRQELHVSNSG